jgi:hypothetical protein
MLGKIWENKGTKTGKNWGTGGKTGNDLGKPWENAGKTVWAQGARLGMIWERCGNHLGRIQE